MTYSPTQLNLRAELLRPRDTKNDTGNTKGEYTSYGTRYTGIVRAGGQDQMSNDQNTATRTVTWVARYDANIKPSWIIRYGNQDYYIDAAIDPDNGAKRYLELLTVVIDAVTLVS